MRSKTRSQYDDRCNMRCPGGNRCDCHEGIVHDLCICTDPKCKCHGKERYERTKPKPQPHAGIKFYKPPYRYRDEIATSLQKLYSFEDAKLMLQGTPWEIDS